MNDFHDLFISAHECIMRRSDSDQHGGISRVDPDSPSWSWVKSLFQECEERRKTFGNEFSLVFQDKIFRVSYVPGVETEHYALRVQPSTVRKLDEISMQDFVRESLKKRRVGLTIFTGSFGQGKTTLATSTFSWLLEHYGGVGIAIEDPIEIPLAGHHGYGFCMQVEITGERFPEMLKRSARWRPDFIFLGEIRDGATLFEAVKAGLNGAQVLSTFHADSVDGAFLRLYAMLSETTSETTAAGLLSDAISGLTHQTFDRVNQLFRVKAIFMDEHDIEHSVRGKIRARQFGNIVNDMNIWEANARRRLKNLNN